MKKGIRTVCGFCHAGCGLIVSVHPSGKYRIQGDPEHPANRGYCCQKIMAIHEFLHSPDRLRQPLRKTRSGLEKISWDEALNFAAEKLGEVREKYGPTSLVRNGGAPVNYDARDGYMEFMGAFGSPNITGSGNLCMVPFPSIPLRRESR